MVKIDIHTNDIDNFLYHLRKLKEHNQLYMETIEIILDLVKTISEMVEPQVQEYETDATTEATAEPDFPETTNQDLLTCTQCYNDMTREDFEKHNCIVPKSATNDDTLDALLDDL